MHLSQYFFTFSLFSDHDVCEVRFPKGGTSILDEMGFSASHFWYNIFALLGLNRICIIYEKIFLYY